MSVLWQGEALSGRQQLGSRPRPAHDRRVHQQAAAQQLQRPRTLLPPLAIPQVEPETTVLGRFSKARTGGTSGCCSWARPRKARAQRPRKEVAQVRLPSHKAPGKYHRGDDEPSSNAATCCSCPPGVSSPRGRARSSASRTPKRPRIPCVPDSSQGPAACFRDLRLMLRCTRSTTKPTFTRLKQLRKSST